MTKMKYVGLKDSETAFKSETGLTWTPGCAHEVEDDTMVARMLQHPDVFALADARAVKVAKEAPVEAVVVQAVEEPKSDQAGDTAGMTLAPGAAVPAAPVKTAPAAKKAKK